MVVFTLKKWLEQSVLKMLFVIALWEPSLFFSVLVQVLPK
ncbi:hypothetical protein VCHENC03_3873 [Vibrio sp. HENC-03]|nr:hypothetical protein VCHENC03_3873 [Vibrio sp. HENC-03]